MKKIKKEIVNKLPYDKDVEENTLSLTYDSNRQKIRDLLLFLNVFQLNTQIEALRKKSSDQLMAPIYKFPFDLYVSQRWDIEHIDSATENDLKNEKDKRAWIEQSLPFLNKKEREEINISLEEGKYDVAIRQILQMTRDDDNTPDDKETKDSIGNLTLLDVETNRSYKNHIFALKRHEILEAIKGGKFVPLCTQLVFNKNFDNKNIDLRKWNKTDKQYYQDFIIGQLNKFYKSLQNE